MCEQALPCGISIVKHSVRTAGKLFWGSDFLAENYTHLYPIYIHISLIARLRLAIDFYAGHKQGLSPRETESRVEFPAVCICICNSLIAWRCANIDI